MGQGLRDRMIPLLKNYCWPLATRNTAKSENDRSVTVDVDFVGEKRERKSHVIFSIANIILGAQHTYCCGASENSQDSGTGTGFLLPFANTTVEPEMLRTLTRSIGMEDIFATCVFFSVPRGKRSRGSSSCEAAPTNNYSGRNKP